MYWLTLPVLGTALLFGCGGSGPGGSLSVPSENAYEVNGRVYYPVDSAVGFRQQGIASWYGKQFHEKKTANGETYNMHAMTAAHKTLPFGTMVEVINIENRKSTIVRINDRGPFCRDRIIDLSYSAAREIGMIINGTAAVEIIALGSDDEYLSDSGGDPKTAYFTGDFTIQAGAFSNPDNAENFKKSLEKITPDVHIASFIKNGLTFYRVRVGRFTSLKQARETEKHLFENGFKNVYTVAWDL